MFPRFARELKPEEFQKKKRERVEEDPNPNPVSEVRRPGDDRDR